MSADFLLDSFGEGNKEEVKATLLKLIPHINTDNVILCGGLAVRYHLKKNNIEFNYDREFNDLDLLLKDISDLKPSVSNDFIIYHYHDYLDKKKDHADDLFIALVDEEPKIKIDIFSYVPYIPFDPEDIYFEGIRLQIRNPEDQLATQILESAVILHGGKIDPKWIENIEGLLKITDPNKTDRYFHNKHYYKGVSENPFTESAFEVYEKIKKQVIDKPELFVVKATRKDPYKCELCENKNGFTVAPMDYIYKILGYTE
jgi:hypothetical protein